MGDISKSCCTPKISRDPHRSDLKTSRTESASNPSIDDTLALPGGRFLMGTDYAQGFPDDGEGPVRPVVLSPFTIDVTPVTNAQFAEFIQSSGYITEAEKFGWSFVFWADLPKERFSSLVNDTVAQAPWWCQVYGARWNHPEGPGSHINQRLDYPVVHVSWNDAAAYAAWCGKRLPTEAEWEYAARGGLKQKLFPWGDELAPEGKHLCNVWQGNFPSKNSCEDGYSGTCPVRAFPPNEYGLYSVTGNVWEWTADWFGTKHQPTEVTDPQGPTTADGKVMKGGSFLCHASYCNRYRVAARTQNTPDSSSSNIGFRCVL